MTMSVREAARKRHDLSGADAQGLEGALQLTERERGAAREEIKALRAELETGRMRLAACGVAASGGDTSEILPEYESDALAAIRKLCAELEAARADVVAASGELMVEVPSPGTDMARVMLANAAMRRERNEAREELQRMSEALAHFGYEVEAASAHLENKNKGGMRVSFHGDFVNCPPSAISRLRWHVRNLRGE